MEQETEIKSSGNREVKIVAGQEYWSAKKAARYLGVSKVTVTNFARQNRITKLCLGPYNLFKKEWLDEFINERTTIGIEKRKGGNK